MNGVLIISVVLCIIVVVAVVREAIVSRGFDKE